METTNAKFNYEECAKFLAFLNNNGIDYTNIRVFGKNTISKIISTHPEEGMEEVKKLITSKGLDNKTINCTFNSFDIEKIGNANSIRDADISYHSFLFVDIDSTRDAGTSATNDEKSNAEKVFSNVSKWIESKGIDCLKIDSGNGYHLLIALEKNEDVKRVTNLKKTFLTLLSKKFSTPMAEIDTTVYNSSRLCKLVGCVASKGVPTIERPHRVSHIIDYPKAQTNRLSIEVLKSLVDELNEEYPDKKLTNKKTSKKRAGVKSVRTNGIDDVLQWMALYPDLKYHVKDGNNEGVKIIVFANCPLKDHTNNPNGASLTIHPDGYVQFKCHHESHKEISISDFINKFPKPKISYSDVVPTISIEGLKNGKVYSFYQYQISEKGVFINNDDESIRISSPIFIDRVITNLDSQKIRFNLNYLSSNNMWLNKEFEGSVLQQSRFKQLTEYGIELKSRNEAECIDFLVLQKRSADHIKEFSKIGWQQLEDDKQAYYLNTEFSDNSDDSIVLDPKSIYDFGSKGQKTKFMNMIESTVKGTDAELAIAIGISPILLGYLRTYENIDLLNIIVNFYGKSSSGKTTMQVLIASLYGNPNSLVNNLNATQNAIIKMLTDNNGVPVILDELGTNNGLDLSSLVYQISSGKQKLRLNQSSEYMEQKEFQTVPIFSSETSLSEYLATKDGLLVRYVEFKNVRWAKSAKSSEKIKKICNENYGFFVPAFLEKLMHGYTKSISGIFEEERTKLINKMEEHPLRERMSKNLALIMTSVELINLLLDLDFDSNNIQKMLIESNTQMLSNSIDEKDHYELLCEIIINNSSKFINQRNTSKNSVFPSSVWGRYKVNEEGKLIVNILKNRFEKIIKNELKGSEIKDVVECFKNRQKINSESGRNTKRITVNAEIITTYEIVLPSEAAIYFRGATTPRDTELSVNRVFPQNETNSQVNHAALDASIDLNF